MPASPPPLTRSRALSLAWPIVGAQVATAMTGVVDTAVMGRVGDKTDLAAVAIAAVSFSFLYWAFGFLRMATTGLTAQAVGSGDRAEQRAVLIRALIVGGGLGAILIAGFPAIRAGALWAFGGSASAEAGASAYFAARIGGAPAALMGYAVNGWLLGTGRTRALLGLQIVLNGANVALDVGFVAGLGWGPAGIGAGTAIAEWIALGVGLWAVRDGIGWAPRIADRRELAAMFAVNRDVMVRTLALLGSFAWFVDAGASIGEAEVAGNQVLLQFIAVSAFVLDAFAFVAEREVGEAFGRGDRGRLIRAARTTTELALAFGACFCAIFAVTGAPIIDAFIADPDVRAAALARLPWCAAVPLIGVAAWQLDGVFLGATRGAALRNASVAAALLYVGTDLILRPRYGNLGVWMAFVAMYIYRALTLAVFVPGLLEDIPLHRTPRAESAQGE